ncbi:Hypothetical protein A7982_04446 [Minicystis rosea]|nr:Hypothetical protein A7982_04446 [Minicystis rosea]
MSIGMLFTPVHHGGCGARVDDYARLCEMVLRLGVDVR